MNDVWGLQGKAVLKALNPRVIGRREEPIALVHRVCLYGVRNNTKDESPGQVARLQSPLHQRHRPHVLLVQLWPVQCNQWPSGGRGRCSEQEAWYRSHATIAQIS